MKEKCQTGLVRLNRDIANGASSPEAAGSPPAPWGSGGRRPWIDVGHFISNGFKAIDTPDKTSPEKGENQTRRGEKTIPADQWGLAAGRWMAGLEALETV